MARHNTIGKLGEDIATKWLVDERYVPLERNYQKKYGEIDIIAKKNDILHFFEVKTVSYGTRDALLEIFSRETYRPEENVHKNKQTRLSRVIQVWLEENAYRGKWQIDILAVYVVPHEKYARIALLENVIFE